MTRSLFRSILIKAVVLRSAQDRTHVSVLRVFTRTETQEAIDQAVARHLPSDCRVLRVSTVTGNPLNHRHPEGYYCPWTVTSSAHRKRWSGYTIDGFAVLPPSTRRGGAGPDPSFPAETSLER